MLAHGICDALRDAVLVDAANLPQNMEDFDPVLLGYWCDRGMAPEDMLEACKKIHNKRIGCFATLGGDPESDWARKWVKETSEKLVSSDSGNSLEATFVCRGRIDPVIFDLMTKMTGGVVTPEREARRKESETHPDRVDVLRAVEVFSRMHGVCQN